MLAVVQRVTSASVVVNDQTISSIGKGICVLIGIAHNDGQSDIDFIVRKLINLRIFEGPDGKKWDKSISDFKLEILCVSQFTLCATLKGNRPDYHLAMGPDKAPSFYSKFLETLKSRYEPDLVKDGQFGAYMHVSIENDGPVTISIDSRRNGEKSD